MLHQRLRDHRTTSQSLIETPFLKAALKTLAEYLLDWNSQNHTACIPNLFPVLHYAVVTGSSSKSSKLAGNSGTPNMVYEHARSGIMKILFEEEHRYQAIKHQKFRANGSFLLSFADALMYEEKQ